MLCCCCTNITNYMTPTEAAYIAGFLDGEGTICLERNKRPDGFYSYGFRISFKNTNLGVLEWIKEKIGGGGISADNRNHKVWATAYSLKIPSSLSVETALTLLPYLVIKRQQAEMLIEYRKQFNTKRDQYPGDAMIKDCFYFTMKELNKRGR